MLVIDELLLCTVNMIIAGRCEKTSLINLPVLFCKMDLAFVGEKRMAQNAVSDQCLHCLH